MLTIEQVKQARTPQEALLLLATAIDHLHARIDELPSQSDAWTQPLWAASDPDPNVNFIGAAKEAVTAQAGKAAAIAALEAKRATEHDPAEIRALDAQIRLAKDEGQALPPIVPEGNRPKITVEGIEVVPVSQERQADRVTWALARGLEQFIGAGWSAADAAQAYAKGGPMWLYQGNRDAVMSMPFNYRQELVREIALDSEADAQEAGRDILKSMDSTERAITVAAIENLSGR